MTDDQLTDLAGMTPADIETARITGRLDDLLGITRHRPTTEQWTKADFDAMYAEKRYVEIEDARVAGQLKDLLNPPEDITS